MQVSRASVLILAPVGRDAEVAAAIVKEVGIAATRCSDLDGVVTGLSDADCAILTEEALLSSNRQALADWIAQQPPWSDFPFILLTQRGLTPDPRLRKLLANVTVLERPFHPDVLADAVGSALRARKRQREVQAHLEERQRTHERQALLIRELHHRVKNTLATVQALVGATARSAKSVDEFYHAFVARIVALANTHTMLTEDYWQTASLGEILSAELGPYQSASADRVILEGPVVQLQADLAVPLGMAIHELSTNAAKYGALSVPEGKLQVRWEVLEHAEARKLRLDWTERGGPPVEEPSRRGFGSTLIRRILTTQCHADIRYEFEPSGVHFRLEAPLVQERLVPHYNSP
ncbi:sensor histidine kinase [Microvirga sp. TS319]|uniref:sensor histidine kinase n=1 Tax=Microvirga sp. TS319 TaxID=3241165 RepID=UPI00351AA7C3